MYGAGSVKFLFSHFLVVHQETPRRSLKIKTEVNFHFNTAFWNAWGGKGYKKFAFHILEDWKVSLKCTIPQILIYFDHLRYDFPLCQ